MKTERTWENKKYRRGRTFTRKKKRFQVTFEQAVGKTNTVKAGVYHEKRLSSKYSWFSNELLKSLLNNGYDICIYTPPCFSKWRSQLLNTSSSCSGADAPMLYGILFVSSTLGPNILHWLSDFPCWYLQRISSYRYTVWVWPLQRLLRLWACAVHCLHVIYNSSCMSHSLMIFAANCPYKLSTVYIPSQAFISMMWQHSDGLLCQL